MQRCSQTIVLPAPRDHEFGVQLDLEYRGASSTGPRSDLRDETEICFRGHALVRVPAHDPDNRKIFGKDHAQNQKRYSVLCASKGRAAL
ncbi:hypothetical protein MES4922_120158 [Mesorhizobium ventifaucium]|uniref:Uncharacterized protein n=1 Tax=Mesorhizobium ventifaucium TaxID=666020 RepID=A0ABM9DFS4_9HYPH|nr:hypothetical protein MES4922_120158 [Mesorhizobium ventifaucium]